MKRLLVFLVVVAAAAAVVWVVHAGTMEKKVKVLSDVGQAKIMVKPNTWVNCTFKEGGAACNAPQIKAYIIDDQDDRVTAHPNKPTLFHGTLVNNKAGIFLPTGKNYILMVRVRGTGNQYYGQWVRLLDYQPGRGNINMKVVNLFSNTNMWEKFHPFTW